MDVIDVQTNPSIPIGVDVKQINITQINEKEEHVILNLCNLDMY